MPIRHTQRIELTVRIPAVQAAQRAERVEDGVEWLAARKADPKGHPLLGPLRALLGIHLHGIGGAVRRVPGRSGHAGDANVGTAGDEAFFFAVAVSTRFLPFRFASYNAPSAAATSASTVS